MSEGDRETEVSAFTVHFTVVTPSQITEFSHIWKK